MANVVSTVETASLPSHTSARVEEERVDTRFSGCNLRCIVQVPREEVRLAISVHHSKSGTQYPITWKCLAPSIPDKSTSCCPSAYADGNTVNHIVIPQVCANTQTGVTHQPAITFWSYLLVRVLLGVLTAASLMMFEGAVMATIQG